MNVKSFSVFDGAMFAIPLALSLSCFEIGFIEILSKVQKFDDDRFDEL
jgi:hypothetical protein